MISQSVPIEAPGGFAPVMALGRDNGQGQLTLVSSYAPLPTIVLAPDTPAAFAGEASAAQVVGPFTPATLVPVYLTLAGDWTGSVRVLRSVDGGTTRHPLTLGGSGWACFSANACEPVWIESEMGAQLYLDLAPASGTLAYRIAQ